MADSVCVGDSTSMCILWVCGESGRVRLGTRRLLSTLHIINLQHMLLIQLEKNTEHPRMSNGLKNSCYLYCRYLPSYTSLYRIYFLQLHSVICKLLHVVTRLYEDVVISYT